jgi:hypothetical protein
MRPISFSSYAAHPIFDRDLLGRSKAEPAAEPQPDLYILTPQQQMALLTVRRTDLCQEVVRKLTHSTMRASEIDYLELTKRGLIARQGTRRIVTYLGKRRADRIANELAKELSLHFFCTGARRFESYVACSCGWSYSHSRNEGHERRAFGRRMAEHLRDVNEPKATVVAGNGFSDWPTSTEEPLQDQAEAAS